MNSIEKDFADTLSILTDFNQKAKVLVAFSGGCDSLALLKLCLLSLPKGNVCALYVNHQIRSQSELLEEINLNKENCKKLGASLVIKTIDKQRLTDMSKKSGTEAAARSLRYEILEKYAKENCFDYIATAHHYDDQIETILMKVMDRAPVTALRGISEKKGKLIRPLLEFSKKDLENYLSNFGLKFSTDSTNSDNSYKRNEIRNVIIPGLRDVMPDFEKRLLGFRSYAFSQCSEIDYKCGPVEVSYFNSLSKADKYQILYRMWDNSISALLPSSLIERVISSCEKKTFALESSNGGTFCLHKGKLMLVPEEANYSYEQFYATVKPYIGETLLPDEKKLVISNAGDSVNLHLSPKSIRGKLSVRYVRCGDEIVLKDGKKKVLRLLQDMKIPPVLRKKALVLCEDSTVVAVFAAYIGGRDRICASLRSSLESESLFIYIK